MAQMYKFNDDAPCSKCIVRACCSTGCQALFDFVPETVQIEPTDYTYDLGKGVAVVDRKGLPRWLRDHYDYNFEWNGVYGFELIMYDPYTIGYGSHIGKETTFL